MFVRLRRYRVSLVFAVLLTILFYHLSLSTEWDDVVPIVDELRKESAVTHGPESPPPEITTTISRPILHFPSTVPGDQEPKSTTSTTTSSTLAEETVLVPAIAPLDPTKTSDSPKTVPDIGIPNRKPAKNHAEQQKEFDELHPQSPGRLEQEVIFTPPAIHWEPQPEHFPVPTESIIQLPTGKPIPIPKIQYDFGPESAEAKADREKKKNEIRDEAKRAWTGYKEHAWMHDELSPVSGQFKDPFGGWAATLVDSLDTLWIMDLIPEFEEAVNAVKLIDFTTTFRSDIPMFETTIRYLGGLLAAYDLSGGKYRGLLDKAVELGEILYSAFDTPNRMPVLFYQWKPVFASQPHRASVRAGTAELGSMAMEFTRLAQLTKEPRYYDAVARITNALEEYQNLGTGLPGVFPDDLDASGCNWTQPELPTPVEEPHGYEPAAPKLPAEPEKHGASMKNPEKLEFQVIPEAGGLGKARIQGWEENHSGEKRNDGAKPEVDGSSKEIPLKRMRRQLDDPSMTVDTTPKAHKSGADKAGSITPGSGEYKGPALDFTPKPQPTWDCTPQGLVGVKTRYSMGGGQDSTYEYFPKQYVLLGGLEDKYRTMYLKVIDAVRKHMLYRPMIPDERNILFSGSVQRIENSASKFDAEVTHLTCFLGGMVGMGAKLFNIEGDLEIAKRLTDGCVWAYESMPSGIMAEGAHLLPCESVNNCPWNETLYHHAIDPNAKLREKSRADYFKKKETALAAAAKEAEAKRLASVANTTIASKDVKTDDEAALLLEKAKDFKPSSENTAVLDAPKPKASENMLDPIHKRQLNKDDAPKTTADEAYEKSKLEQIKGEKMTADEAYEYSKLEQIKGETAASMYKDSFTQKLEKTEQELEAQNPRGSTYKSTNNVIPTLPKLSSIPNLDGKEPIDPNWDPQAPLSHAQYVKNRIHNENLQPGYMGIERREYILRPEAIESVWYMYRITGDPIWQAKGWKMWQSIIKATTSTYGHSAIRDVTIDPETYNGDINFQKDSMESFWIAETLKYFYLLYSEPGVVSLDEWVLNTEAHPFRRPA